MHPPQTIFIACITLRMAPELHLILRNAQFMFLTCMNEILVTQVHKSCHVGSSVFAIFLLRDSLWNSLPCGNRINIWWITTPPASSFKATKGPPKNEILSVIQTGAILRCYFLPSSWCQRSPSEKVETFLPFWAHIIFSQMLESSCSRRPTSTGTKMEKDHL